MSEIEDLSDLNLDELLGVSSGTPAVGPKPPVAKSASVEETELEDFVFKTETHSGVVELVKPWMQYHKFTLVKEVSEVRQIVDDAIAHGRCALDLETEGLDNRIDYDENGLPSTRHRIVGFCISVRGHGYYLPVRHRFQPVYGEKNPNLPVAQTEEEIKRLCLAAMPEMKDTPALGDPRVAGTVVAPPKVVIYFWNAKFDQEFLYPITGIDYWPPQSFEDGYLAAYTYYTDDDSLGLKAKSKQNLKINGHPYEMIELADLSTGKKKDIDFAGLLPGVDPNVARYGCSDAICTELLCEAKPTKWDLVGEDLKYEYVSVLAKLSTRGFQTTYKLEKRTAQAVRLMERARVKIDKSQCAGILAEALEEKTLLDQKIKATAAGLGWPDFNPGSPQQLSDFLFSAKGLDLKDKPPKNEASGQYKTDAKTLEGILERDPEAPEFISWIIKLRQIDKVIGTYLTSMQEDTDEHDQLRFKFHQTGAATGRFTAPKGDPGHGYARAPVHGIPARDDPSRPAVAQSLRKLFVAREGYTFVKIDYAGQELRVVTNLSREPLWEKEFLEGSGDLHTLTAQAFFGPHITKAHKAERQMGKCVHPETAVYVNGQYSFIGSIADFPKTPDTFAKFSGRIDDNRPVKAIYNGGVKPLVHVVTSSGILTCTPEHRFVFRDNSLVRAGDLQPGDLLIPTTVPVLAKSKTALDEDHLDRVYSCGSQFRTLGPRAFPKSLWHENREVAMAYLSGVFDKAASVIWGSLVWVTSDLFFASKVAMLSRACGLDFKVSMKSAIEGLSPEVCLRYTVRSTWEFEQFLMSQKKLNALRRPGTVPPRSGDRFQVVAVLPAGEHPCVDVTLGTRAHLYQANGMLTHNTANFSLIYGGGVQAIQRATKCDKHEAARKKKSFDASVPVFAKWVQNQHALVKKHLGVTNGFGRFIRIPHANPKLGDPGPDGRPLTDKEDVRRLIAGAERQSTNYPVQGSGADILKLSMVMLQKELSVRGWLRNGGDDSVRMLMTVHDEIVFEVRDERIMEVVPLLIDIMQSPSTLVKWKVPLIVEPLLGKSWNAKYDWVEILAGKAEPPEWLAQYFSAGMPDRKPFVAAPTSPTTDSPTSTPAPSISTPTQPPVSSVIPPGKTEVAVFYISAAYLTNQSIRLVQNAINMSAWDPDSLQVGPNIKKLCLVEQLSGDVLIPAKFGILVDPDEFGRQIRSQNLGPGVYQIAGDFA